MTRTCPHPLCHTPLQRERHACGRHYHSLPEELRDEMRRAQRSHDQSWIARAAKQWEEYFATRVIGKLEIVKCRGQTCGQDLVWFRSRGKSIPVHAETVRPGDAAYDPDRHVRHFGRCPDQDNIPRTGR